MSDNETADEMRLYALELMVSSHFAALHVQDGAPAASLKRLRSLLVEKTRRNPFRGLDPAVSDMASAELEEAFDRLIRMQAAYLGIDLPKD